MTRGAEWTGPDIDRILGASWAREAHETWRQAWIQAWREIGWHAQVDLRLSRRDARHAMPWGTRRVCERCHVYAPYKQCRHCMVLFCVHCIIGTCPHTRGGHE
jgi:hypothetical protein